MSQNAINYEEVKRDLVAVAGKSNKIEPLVGALVGILDSQPELAQDRDRHYVLDVSIYGARYTLSSRNGAIWMHSTVGGVVGYFSDENHDSCIRETFETLPRTLTH